MLLSLLEAAGLSAQQTASLLGINAPIFQEWATGQRPIPPSAAHTLAAVLGVDPSLLVGQQRAGRAREVAEITPAIWFKFRGERLVDEDRECVFLIRRLGHFINELEEVTERRSVGWKSLFEDIRRSVDIQAPPRVQGRQAARMFRESRGLGKGAVGIGEVIRGNLRSMGVLVIESPIPESSLEGCAFHVGPRSAQRPCIFANTHHVTWFRRNVVVMHETAHAIFEAESAGASLDFVDSADESDLAEERAQAFAQEVLVPRSVLQHLAQSRGIRWEALDAERLALLVADAQVEKRTLLEAAHEAELVSSEQLDTYLGFEIAQQLPQLTDHALSAEDYVRKVGAEADPWLGKRSTTVPSRTLRLPSAYINGVLEAFKEGYISEGKAAEILMVDVGTFADRFSELVEPAEV